MVRQRAGLVALVLCLVALPALAQAQEATPGATPVDGAVALDLPAMVLFPADMDEDGLELASGTFFDAEFLVSPIMLRTGWSEEEVRDRLAATGHGRNYTLTLEKDWPAGMATPTGTEGEAASKRVITTVTEYPSAEAAAAGFALIEVEAEESGRLPGFSAEEDRSLSSAIGDEAELTYSTGATSDSQIPYATANLTFRDGNLIGDVFIDNLVDLEEPDVAELERLARKLLARMEMVRNGEAPDLSQRVLRLEGQTYYDHYERLAGLEIVRAYDPSDYIAERQGRISAEAKYIRDQDISVGDQPAYLMVQLLQYASPVEAESYSLADWLTRVLAPDSGYMDVTELTDLPALGDDAVGVGFTYPGADAFSGWYGHTFVIREGSYVAVMRVEQPGDASLDVALDLAEAQAACLVSGGCDVPQGGPAGLLGGTATPAP